MFPDEQDDDFEIELSDEEENVVESEGVEPDDDELEDNSDDSDSYDDDSEESDDTPENRKQFGRRAQKRIKTLLGRQKAMEAEIAQYRRVLAEQSGYAKASAQQSVELEESTVSANETRLDAEEANLEQQFAAALDEQDAKKLFTINARLAEVKAERIRLTEAKANVAKKKEALSAKPEAKDGESRNQPDPKALAWGKRNTWFGTNEKMTRGAYAIHAEIIQEGVDPTSDEYYEELDARLRKRFPAEFRTKPKPSARQVLANGNAGKPGTKTKVKLTKDEVALANRLGISVEQYAREKALRDARENS